MSPAPLEQQLLALGAALELPPAPDVAARAVAMLPERDAARRRVSRRTRRALALAFALALLLAATAIAVPATRHAILDGLGLRGVSIQRVQPLPRLPRREAAGLGLGRRIPLARARHAADFTALLPARASAAYFSDDVPGGRVSLLIGRVLATEVHGNSTPVVIKLAGLGTRVRRVRVGRDNAAYLSHGPHQLLFLGRNGEFVQDRVRLPGDVLLWQHGSLVIAIEGVHSLAQARAVARSLH